MRYFIFALIFGLLCGSFLILSKDKEIEISSKSNTDSQEAAAIADTTTLSVQIIGSGAPEAIVAPPDFIPPPRAIKDIEPQKKLANPPEVVKALYATSWSAASESKINALIKLIKETELNAIVIDIKDFSGHVLYDISNEEVIKYGAKEVRIPRLNALIKRLHDEGIYVIARITVFQDPVLAKARPDLAIRNKNSGGIWYDRKNLSWIDPAAKDAWDYNIAIAKDAAARGFDELNFDYVRFASDGDLAAMEFPIFEATSTLKRTVIKSFFAYLREKLPTETISADIFGLTTINRDDLGIGQIIEDAFLYFDAVAPMTYPSHYAPGFLGYKNPAEHPYEVVKYSLESALTRLLALQKTKQIRAKLRPWLQDFDLGADYGATEVRSEIQAVYDAYKCPSSASNATSVQTCAEKDRLRAYGGWMIWSPSNVYTQEALLKE